MALSWAWRHRLGLTVSAAPRRRGRRRRRGPTRGSPCSCMHLRTRRRGEQAPLAPARSRRGSSKRQRRGDGGVRPRVASVASLRSVMNRVCRILRRPKTGARQIGGGGSWGLPLSPCGTIGDMAKTKVSLTLDAEAIEALTELTGSSSLSATVTDAVAEKLERIRKPPCDRRGRPTSGKRRTVRSRTRWSNEREKVWRRTRRLVLDSRGVESPRTRSAACSNSRCSPPEGDDRRRRSGNGDHPPRSSPSCSTASVTPASGRRSSPSRASPRGRRPCGHTSRSSSHRRWHGLRQRGDAFVAATADAAAPAVVVTGDAADLRALTADLPMSPSRRSDPAVPEIARFVR